MNPCQAPGHFPPPWFAQTEGLHVHVCQACVTRTTVRIPPPPGDGFPPPGVEFETSVALPKSASSVYRLAGLIDEEGRTRG